MNRCICTISKDDVTKRCPHEAIHPTRNPKYCGKHVRSRAPQVYVRSPSPPRRRNYQLPNY